MPSTKTVLVGVVTAALAATMVVVPASAGAGEETISEELASLKRSVDLPVVPDRTKPSGLTFEQQALGDAILKVEILFEASDSEVMADAVVAAGGQVVGSAPGLLLVEISESQIADLRSSRGDQFDAREPLDVNLEPEQPAVQIAGSEVVDITALTNAVAWQAAGERGGGVKVGIIDFFDGAIWNSAQASGAVPASAGTFCLVVGAACDIWGSGSRHGVAVAETVYTMAPEATIYLATVVTTTDLAAAVQWFDEQGVKVISRSLGSPLDSAGNGTGSLNAIVDDAVSRGMAWFNSGGNHASASGTDLGSYWRGSWADADANGWLDFAPGDETLGLLCSFIQGFRWSDWAGNATDYDVYIFNPDLTLLLAASEDYQTAGVPPLEMVGEASIDCAVYPVVYLAVRLFDVGNGTSGDILEFMANNSAFEYSTNQFSSSAPISDSSNAGMMAVGAIDPGNGIAIAPYSSQGPTNDGRTKPDVSAPSCFPSVSYAPDCFNGTSAAAPVAAGAAAILMGANEAATPKEIVDYLRVNAIDRGASGTDNVFGSGQLWLGSPPAPVPLGIHSVALIDAAQGQWSYYSLSGEPLGSFFYGNPGDAPFMGDWDCDGIETPGLYRQSDGFAYLRNSNSQGNADISFFFGNPGDVPIGGDFNGDGCDTLSIYRPSEARFYIVNKLGVDGGSLGPAEFSYLFGDVGDKPFAGDFDGDGVETVGLHRESTGLVYFRNSHTQGNADSQFIFGDPGDRIVAGDWNDDGMFSPALFRPSSTTMFFRYTNTAGNADQQFQAGQTNWIPVSGYIGDPPGLQ